MKHVVFSLFNATNVLSIRRRSYPLKSDSDRPIRFAVRSLGWVEIAEEDLTPERSSKAVNKCIVDLSLGRNDVLDVVGRWGDVSIVAPSEAQPTTQKKNCKIVTTFIGIFPNIVKNPLESLIYE